MTCTRWAALAVESPRPQRRLGALARGAETQRLRAAPSPAATRAPSARRRAGWWARRVALRAFAVRRNRGVPRGRADQSRLGRAYLELRIVPPLPPIVGTRTPLSRRALSRMRGTPSRGNAGPESGSRLCNCDRHPPTARSSTMRSRRAAETDPAKLQFDDRVGGIGGEEAFEPAIEHLETCGLDASANRFRQRSELPRHQLLEVLPLPGQTLLESLLQAHCEEAALDALVRRLPHDARVAPACRPPRARRLFLLPSRAQPE